MLPLVVQSNCEAEKCNRTAAVPDNLSSDRFTAVAIKGYLNYKATHHEGKVIIQHLQILHKFTV